MIRKAAPPLPPWLEALVPFERYAVEVDNRLDMHVMEKGKGHPVILLHGNPTWGVLYRKVVNQLDGSGLRLIMPDLIGLGFSSKPRKSSDHTIENHGRWLGRLLQGLELTKCVVVVQDWGGAIGVRALIDNPDIDVGLVVLNTVLGPPKPGFRPTLFHRLAQAAGVGPLLFRGLRFPQSFLNIAQGDKKSIRGNAARAYRYPLRRWKDNAAPLALARMVPDSNEHPSISSLAACQKWVETFDGPAEIVWGKRDPILGSVLNWIKKLLPQARCTVTEAGHFLQEEVPREIATAISRVAETLFGDS